MQLSMQLMTLCMSCVFSTEKILGWSKLLQPINYRCCGRKPIRTSRLLAGTWQALLSAWLKAILLWYFRVWASFSEFVYAFCISPVLSAWWLFFIVLHPQNGRSIRCFGGEGRHWKRASSRGIGSVRQRAETHPRRTQCKNRELCKFKTRVSEREKKKEDPCPSAVSCKYIFILVSC